MQEETPSPTTPPAGPEAPGPIVTPGGRPTFAWWGWVLLLGLIVVLIWFLV